MGGLSDEEPLASRAAQPAENRPPVILIAEDDPAFRRLLDVGLTRAGFVVKEAHDGPELLARLSEPGEHCDLVLTDFRMPHLSGEVLLESLHELRPALPVVVMTAFADAGPLRLAARLGAQLLSKPFSIGRLVQVIGCGLSRERYFAFDREPWPPSYGASARPPTQSAPQTRKRA